MLPQLLGNTIVLQPTDLPDQPNHQAHFKPGPDQLEVPSQFNRTLLTLLSTSPVASPSGGFTYTFDPALGTFRRTSESFGPTFAERALTIGRGRVSVGFGYQHSTYDTFEGLNLRDRGAVTFYVPHTDCCSRAGGVVADGDGSRLTPAFEGDLVREELALRLTTDASVVVANYGVHDRFDIGVVVPFLHVALDASVLATIERLSTAAEPEIHSFGGAEPDQRPVQRGRPRQRPGRHRRAHEIPGAGPPPAAAWPWRWTCGCRPATSRTCSAPAACSRSSSPSGRSRSASSPRTSTPATPSPAPGRFRIRRYATRSTPPPASTGR